MPFVHIRFRTIQFLNAENTQYRDVRLDEIKGLDRVLKVFTGFDRGLTSIEKILLRLLPIIWTERKYSGLADGGNLRHIMYIYIYNLDNGQDPKQIFLITIMLTFSTRIVGPLDSFLLSFL